MTPKLRESGEIFRSPHLTWERKRKFSVWSLIHANLEARITGLDIQDTDHNFSSAHRFREQSLTQAWFLRSLRVSAFLRAVQIATAITRWTGCCAGFAFNCQNPRPRSGKYAVKTAVWDQTGAVFILRSPKPRGSVWSYDRFNRGLV